MDLTPRQQQLLLTIINEFIDTAEAVGSISLQNKYGFGFSPATIRNEMAELVNEGYLFQRHNSGGRIPTTKGWRYFIETLNETSFKDLDEDLKQKILTDLTKTQNDNLHLLRQSLTYLSKISKNPAILMIDGEVYYAGLSELTDIPEFREYENLKRILRLLEDYYGLSEIFNKGNPDKDTNILIGEETEKSEFRDYAVIFSEIKVESNRKGYIAVVGPNRMKYNEIIPAIKYLSDTIRTMLNN